MIKRGYKPIEATPKLKFKSKTPLNMFILSFRHDESIDKIYEITDILVVVWVEMMPLSLFRNSQPKCV